MIKKLLAFIFLFFIVNTYTVLDNLSDALNNFTKELEQMRVWYVKEVRPDVILTNSLMNKIDIFLETHMTPEQREIFIQKVDTQIQKSSKDVGNGITTSINFSTDHFSVELEKRINQMDAVLSTLQEKSLTNVQDIARKAIKDASWNIAASLTVGVIVSYTAIKYISYLFDRCIASKAKQSASISEVSE